MNSRNLCAAESGEKNVHLAQLSVLLIWTHQFGVSAVVISGLSLSADSVYKPIKLRGFCYSVHWLMLISFC